jgi:chemotaxis protein CheD
MSQPALLAATPLLTERRLNAYPVRSFAGTDMEFTNVRVLPGEHHVTDDPQTMIVTVLGSCVAACIRDEGAGVGGMNHFMLPESVSGNWGKATASLRYGNFAMERLINDILAFGGRRKALEIKVFGGANVLDNNTNIGWKNAEFVEAYLKAEGLPIAARHLCGIYPRRVQYVPTTGRVAMLELRRQSDLAIVETESSYRRMLREMPLDGSAELFE